MSTQTALQRHDIAEGSPDVAGPADRHQPGPGVFIAAGSFIAAYYALTMRALDSLQLHNDLGIQYYLARITSEGSVPLVDFEHGWNTLSWYYSAALYRIADGNATVWVNLWGRGGFIMAAIAMLVLLWRARIPAAWVAGTSAAWIVLTHVAHNKYAIPTLWVAIILPVGDRVRLSWQRALRVGLAATVFWAHVELSILLAIGTAMFDLFGAREGALRSRVVTAVHAPAGVVVGLLSQMAAYSLLGVTPGAFLRQAIGNWTVTDFGPLFDFPVIAPESIRLALFPMLMLVPFVPLLWRRLSDPPRMLALCNLALGLIAIRRPGDGHVAASATLSALVLALGAFDLSRSKAGLRRAIDDVKWSRPDVWLAVVGGAAWYGAGIFAGFQIASFLAIVALTVVVMAGILSERRGQMTPASLGALGMALLIGFVGVGGHLVEVVEQDDALGETRAIAQVVRPELERCAAAGADPDVDSPRPVWIVPSPLTLYDALGVSNPTPFYAFWYNLEGEKDRIIGLMDDGSIPTILQVGAWPQSMDSTVPEIQSRYVPCAAGDVDGSPRGYTVWVRTTE